MHVSRGPAGSRAARSVRSTFAQSTLGAAPPPPAGSLRPPPPGTRCLLDRCGFTLLEVLVAAAVFCTAILAMVGMWSTQARAVAMARDVLAATEVAEHELESTLALGYGLAMSRRGEQVLTVQVEGRDVVRAFAYVVTVGELRAGLKDVVVRVSWSEGGGGHEVVVETALAATS